MALVLEIEISTSQQYIKNYIIHLARYYHVYAVIVQKDEKITCRFSSESEQLQECLDAIIQHLPASLFLKSSKSYMSDETITALPVALQYYPLNLGLCPLCQKEMFDVSSRRYYYPFTSCSCCGGNYSFLNAYPYERAQTSFKFIIPCHSCSSEMRHVGLKEKHPINSCHDCGISVRLSGRTAERYANDAGSFRTMFEVVAKALVDHKKVLIKTTMGYRLFYRTQMLQNHSILMMINASKITEHLSLITEEFHALLSIERPVLHVTLQSDLLKQQYGANTAYVKYPDDGFSILLGAQLQQLGMDFIAYEEVEENTTADLVMDYDIDVMPQRDMRVFINKETLFIADGDRVSFPSAVVYNGSVLSVTQKYIGLPQENQIFFDQIRHFDSIAVEKVKVLEGIEEEFHASQSIFLQDEASFMSVIVEHDLFSHRCIGAYFEEEPSFLYYDSKRVLRIVPPKPFDVSKLLEEIATLREGSDRLLKCIEQSMPQMFDALHRLQEQRKATLFEAVALLLGLNDLSMRSVTSEAMKFIGKGGLQIDTHVTDNRFDNVAFLASIMSYQVAGVSSTLLAYSIFESLGDYFYEILQELQAKTKATEVILCGKGFANQSLFSRIQRNLKMTPPRMNKHYPIGEENAVVGGIYL